MQFDPYETWLGIPADQRPPTHYHLLGLALYESNPATIDQAALRRMSKVRQYQLGPHSERAQEILAELARARLILMDPDRRTHYDAKLQVQCGSRKTTAPAPVVPKGDTSRLRPDSSEDLPDMFASLTLCEDSDCKAHRLRSSPSKGSSWSQRGLIFAAVLISHAALLGAFIYFIFGPWIANQKPSNPLPKDPAPARQLPLLPADLALKKKREIRPTIIAQQPVNRRGGAGNAELAQTDVPLRDELLEKKKPNEVSRESGTSSPREKPEGAERFSPDQRLKDLGLRQEGLRYVLQQEAELREKLKQAQSGFNQCLNYFNQRVEIQSIVDRILWLEQRLIVLNRDIDLYDQNLRNQGPRYSNVDKALFEQARNEREQLDTERIEDRAALGQLRRQFQDPQRAISEIDAKIQNLRQDCESTVGEVRELIDSMNAKYEELAKNNDAKAALAEMERKQKAHLSLGPSPEYNDMQMKASKLGKALNLTTTTPAGKKNQNR